MKTIVILGGGTAGTIMAKKLRSRLGLRDWRIVILDRDDKHVYQPDFIFVPF
jgi:sulfide:quinone oxidoreductase